MFGTRSKYGDDTKGFQQFRDALKPRDRGPDGGNNVVGDSTVSVSTPSPATQTPESAKSAATTNAINATLDAASSIVSLGSIWEGTLKIEGSVRIDGRLSGEVEAGETIYVAESADVNAKVRARYVIVAGRFQGEVQSNERFELMPTGRVKGEVTTKSLVIHEGAYVEGQVHMTGETPFGGQGGRANGKGTTTINNEKPNVKVAAPVPNGS